MKKGFIIVSLHNAQTHECAALPTLRMANAMIPWTEEEEDGNEDNRKCMWAKWIFRSN